MALISAVKLTKPTTSPALGQTSRELCPAYPFHTLEDWGLERGGLCSGHTAGKQCAWARPGLPDQVGHMPCILVVPACVSPRRTVKRPSSTLKNSMFEF